MKDHGVTRLSDGSLRVPARAQHGETIGDGRKVVEPHDPEHRAWVAWLARRGVKVEQLPEERP